MSITPERLEKIQRVLSYRQKDLSLVLANIHDPHNVSAIYRSCDAFGLAQIHLYYTDTAFPLLAKKTSASAKKWIETLRHDNKESLVEKLKGYQILHTSCSPNSRSIFDYDFTQKTAIIMGNEHAGVPEELQNICTGECYIPMYGMIQSFNVSVAAALILQEASRQRLKAGLYEHKTYTNEEYEKLLEIWQEK